jgi:hypothetical protein
LKKPTMPPAGGTGKRRSTYELASFFGSEFSHEHVGLDDGDSGRLVDDVRRLSSAMTLKNAAAEVLLGGRKAVVLDDGRGATCTSRGYGRSPR